MSHYKHLVEVDLVKKDGVFLKENIKEHIFFNILNDCDSNEEQFVWQQMSCENFCKFLENKGLYFKQLFRFNKGDERGLDFYKESYVKSYMDSFKSKNMEKLYKDFEKTVYISCWFDLPWLTKIVFEKYAGEEAGIAIGVNKKKLLSTIDNFAEENGSIKSYEKIFYGNTGYIEDEYKDVVDSDEAIAPLFLKSKYHSSDNEFRLVYIKDSLWISNNDGLALPNDIDSDKHSYTYMSIGDPKDFIDYIAVRDCQKTFYCICKAFNLPIKESTSRKMDGFTVYEIK